VNVAIVGRHKLALIPRAKFHMTHRLMVSTQLLRLQPNVDHQMILEHFSHIYIYVFWYSIWQTFWHFPAIQESFWHSTLHDIYSDPPFSHSNLNLIWNSILSMLNLIWRIFWGILLHYILYNIICPDMLSDILYSICSLILIWQFIWQSTWHIWHMYSFCLNLFDMYSDVPIWHDIWHSVLAGPAR
jgi:hypothetical protein